jgi:hypothetical protein
MTQTRQLKRHFPLAFQFLKSIGSDGPTAVPNYRIYMDAYQVAEIRFTMMGIPSPFKESP